MLEAHFVETVEVVIGEAHEPAEQPPVEEAVVEEEPPLSAEAPGKQAQALLQMQPAALECTQL